jgi:3-hydroxymyristoyl/3-hydroxydecanoyl-(acyl carrier protein) dehydratase
MGKTYDIQAIMEFLPHRYPFILVDRILDLIAGILALESMPAEKRGAPVFFMGMDKVKFRKPVVPGDQLIFEVQILKFRSKVVKASGQALVENNVVAEAELMAALG